MLGSEVLKDSSDDIRACYEHAEHCARKAADEADPKLKLDFLEIERRWLALAHSYEMSGRFEEFSSAHERRRRSNGC